jgi:hypothetical protein
MDSGTVKVVESMKSIIIVGNVVDGLNFYGPFDNAGDAMKYAEDIFKNSTWLVTTLYSRNSPIVRGFKNVL